MIIYFCNVLFIPYIFCIILFVLIHSISNLDWHKRCSKVRECGFLDAFKLLSETPQSTQLRFNLLCSCREEKILASRIARMKGKRTTTTNIVEEFLMRLLPSLSYTKNEINKHHTQNEEINLKWKIENNNGTSVCRITTRPGRRQSFENTDTDRHGRANELKIQVKSSNVNEYEEKK